MKNSRSLFYMMLLLIVAQPLHSFAAGGPDDATAKKGDVTNIMNYFDEIALHEKNPTPDVKTLINPVGYSPINKVTSGVRIYVRLGFASEAAASASDSTRANFESNANNALQKFAPGAYRAAFVKRTYQDDIIFIKQLKGIGITKEEDIDRKFAESGKRRLRPLEVEVSTPNSAYQNIYHLAEIGIADTNVIHGGLFDINDAVMFPLNVTDGRIKREAYYDGLVVAILGDGDLIVQRGMTTYRVRAEKLFAKNKAFDGNVFSPKDLVSYRFQTEGSPQKDSPRIATVNGKLVVYEPSLHNGRIALKREKLDQREEFDFSTTSTSTSRLAPHSYNLAIRLTPVDPTPSLEDGRVLGVNPSGAILVKVYKLGTTVAIDPKDLEGSNPLVAKADLSKEKFSAGLCPDMFE